MIKPILSINNLSIEFETPDGPVHAVNNIACHVNPGECLGIVGESGSGKSQTFLAAMGLLANNGRARGEVLFGGQNLLQLATHELNNLLGDRLAIIFQDPLTSLTPHMRVGEQMAEVLRVHRQLKGSDSEQLCLQWLDRVHIPDGRQRLRQYPHELSGGMRQRVMIAMCMLCQPELLIADEPTTALDVTVQAEILDLMIELQQELDTAIVLITHDMGVVARMCDRIHVMRYGEYIETGSTEDIFYRPQHEYTQMLLDAVPKLNINTVDNVGVEQERAEKNVLVAEDIQMHFTLNKRWFAPPVILRAVDGISFSLNAGETLGIVGESGSGKSTLARAILRLLPVTGGVVSWLGTELNKLDKKAMRHARKDLQIVFQDPLASLDPARTIGFSIMEPLLVHEPSLRTEKRQEQVEAAMLKVGLEPHLINRYPHELSGGQNQRVGIARAMILNPQLIICDEAVSALDVSIQAQILQLLKQLQQDSGLSYLFISHDLSVVAEISHRVMVMYLGSVVELASSEKLFSNPQHPYTQQLISAVPIADPEIERNRTRIKLGTELASPLEPGARLRFLPSKRLTEPDYRPKLLERFNGHFVAEHDAISELIQVVRN